MKTIPMKEYLASSLLIEEPKKLEMNLEALIKRVSFFEMIFRALEKQ